MKVKKTISIMLILITVFWTLGCEDKDTVSPEILSITPADGTTGVAKTTEIKVEFNESMNTISCESRFALIKGELDNMPNDFNDRMHGSFDWNSEQTLMIFHPDSTLMDSTMYSICLKEGMEMDEHDGEMMMSGMSSHGSSVTGGVISKFETEK